MINDEILNQHSGDNSTNIQGRRVSINLGISYVDAKQIAIDVYKENFLRLSEDAARIALERAEKLTENFLGAVLKNNPELLNEVKTPALQSSLYDAQRGFAKTGDENIEEMLVDILQERIATKERNIRQIVLDEAINVCSKLTPNQIDALTLNFIISKTHNHGIISLETFFKFLDEDLTPFCGNIEKGETSYLHLQYCGCATINFLSFPNYAERLGTQYQALFNKGFEIEAAKSRFENFDEARRYIIPCFHNKEKFQVGIVNKDTIKQVGEKDKVSSLTINRLIDLLSETSMNTDEIEKYLLSKRPGLSNLLEIWKNSLLGRMNLTPVGIAIAQSNMRRRTGQKLDLSIWVN